MDPSQRTKRSRDESPEESDLPSSQRSQGWGSSLEMPNFDDDHVFHTKPMHYNNHLIQKSVDNVEKLFQRLNVTDVVTEVENLSTQDTVRHGHLAMKILSGINSDIVICFLKYSSHDHRFGELLTDLSLFSNLKKCEDLLYEEKPLRTLVTKFIKSYEGSKALITPLKREAQRVLKESGFDTFSFFNQIVSSRGRRDSKIQATPGEIANLKNEFCPIYNLALRLLFRVVDLMESLNLIHKTIHCVIYIALPQEYKQFTSIGHDDHHVKFEKSKKHSFSFPIKKFTISRCNFLLVQGEDQGADVLQNRMQQLINYFSPLRVCTVGISGGIKKSDLSLTQVTVPRDIILYGRDMKISDCETPNKSNEEAQIPVQLSITSIALRSTSQRCDPMIVDSLDQFKHRFEWLEKVKKRCTKLKRNIGIRIRKMTRDEFEDILSRNPDFFLGENSDSKDLRKTFKEKIYDMIEPQEAIHRRPCASGPFVVASKNFADRIHKVNSNIASVDMENAGFRAVELKGAKVFTIRGISDLADPFKSDLEYLTKDGVRKLAMQNASDLFFFLAKSNIFSEE